MPVNVGTLLTNLAKKVGYDPALVTIAADAFSAEVPEELAIALEGKLLTEESARNNPKLKSYFASQVLDTMDNNIKSLLDEFEVDEDVRGEILGIKSTYERIPALAKKIRELEAAKGTANKGDKAALQEQINNLNKTIAQITAEKDKAVLEERTKAQQEIAEHMFRHSIESVDLITDLFDKPTMLDIAQKRIQDELKAQGARVVIKDGTLTLVQASDEALDFYKDNKKVTYSDFRDKVLANAKIVKVSNAAGQSGLPAGQSGTPANNGNNSQTTTAAVNPAMNPILAKIERAKADFANTGS
jgi:hypothetical protein